MTEDAAEKLTAPSLGKPMMVYWRLGFWSQRADIALLVVEPGPVRASDRAFQAGYDAAIAFPGQYIPECWTEAQLRVRAYELAVAFLDQLMAPHGLPESVRRNNHAAALKEGLARLLDKA